MTTEAYQTRARLRDLARALLSCLDRGAQSLTADAMRGHPPSPESIMLCRRAATTAGQLHRLLESPDPGSPPAAQEDSGDPSGGVLGSGILRLRRGSPGPARYLYFCRPCGVGSDTRRCPICGERGELARCDEREP